MPRCVVQKYLEQPHLINRSSVTQKGRFKYDIRQWVLVIRFRDDSDGGGLRAYFYKECYLRFAGKAYDTIEGKTASAERFDPLKHLTNNALVKFTPGVDVHDTMWHSSEFSRYLEEASGHFSFEKDLQPQMKKLASLSLNSVAPKMLDRQNTFEILGYDFLIDTKGKVWLLEVNSSPDLGFSTKTTEKLVTQMLQDAATLVLDKEKLGTSRENNLDAEVPTQSDRWTLLENV